MMPSLVSIGSTKKSEEILEGHNEEAIFLLFSNPFRGGELELGAVNYLLPT